VTMRRLATRSVGWFLPSAFATAIGMLPKLIRRRRVRSHETPQGTGGPDHGDRHDSVRPEASEVRSASTGEGPVSDRSDPAEPIHDSLIPLDSASEQIKKTLERRRRRKRAFPEPPVPTFVMVSPDRYIRAEEPASSSVATSAGADEDSPALAILDPTEDTTIPAAASIHEMGNGSANLEFGSPGSSDFDPAGGTGSEDPLVNEPSCDDETEDRSEEGPQSEPEHLAMAVSRSWIIAESGRLADPDGTPSPG
jgi:hypothetical protein